jgi:hypothetical protein
VQPLPRAQPPKKITAKQLDSSSAATLRAYATGLDNGILADALRRLADEGESASSAKDSEALESVEQKRPEE